MGLSLHFELRLPGHTPLARVDGIVAGLYKSARALPFKVVRRMAWHHDSHDALFMAMIGMPSPGEKGRREALDGTARGVLVELGAGCDLAILAFLHCIDDGGARREWRWIGDCQTQVALNANDESCIRGHLSLVALLDRAVALGADVTVRDEGDFWLTRDRVTLLKRMRQMKGPMPWHRPPAGARWTGGLTQS